MTEQCAYKPFQYYGEKCVKCKGMDTTLICFSTRESLQNHLAEFNAIFDMDNGHLEEAIDCINGEMEIF